MPRDTRTIGPIQHEIPLEEAYAKLKNLARAAKLLRERHPAT
jgi:hypothetical protein